MSDPFPIRILVVDDHQLIRVGIATLLLPESDMKLVGEASNGREAIAKYRECRPDVTLMDLQMPEMSGFDAIVAIRDEFPEARIIVLTTYVGDVQAQRAMKAGAQGYVLKNLLHKELLETIRAVYRGRKAMAAEVAAGVAQHRRDIPYLRCQQTAGGVVNVPDRLRRRPVHHGSAVRSVRSARRPGRRYGAVLHRERGGDRGVLV